MLNLCKIFACVSENGGNPLPGTVGKPKKLEDKLVRPEFMASLPKKKLTCSHRKLLLLARELKKAGGEVSGAHTRYFAI